MLGYLSFGGSNPVGAVFAPMAGDGDTVFLTGLDFAVFVVTAGGVNGGANDLGIAFHYRGFTARANRVIVGVRSPCTPKLVGADAEVPHDGGAGFPAIFTNPAFQIFVVSWHGFVPFTINTGNVNLLPLPDELFCIFPHTTLVHRNITQKEKENPMGCQTHRAPNLQ
jgi:hypothetical protein